MSFFRRRKASKEQEQPEDAGQTPEGKTKGAWKRPASVLVPLCHTGRRLTFARYRFQTAAFESLAAYSDTKSSFADLVYLRHNICSNWRSPYLGQQSRE